MFNLAGSSSRSDYYIIITCGLPTSIFMLKKYPSFSLTHYVSSLGTILPLASSNAMLSLVTELYTGF